MVLSMVVRTALWERHLHAVLRIGMHGQAATMGRVYRKSLLLAPHARRGISAGAITNLYAAG